MSLIKSPDVRARVRGIAITQPVASIEAYPVDEAALALERERETFVAALAARDAEIARLEQEVGKAFVRGESEGRKAGLDEGSECKAQALERLQAGLDRALDQINSEMKSLERLSAALAREAVGKMLGESRDRADLVTSIVRDQLARLEAQSVVRVEVSTADFAEAAALDALAAAIGRPSLAITASSELNSGDCRIALALGVMEVGLDQQWGRLSAVLTELAEAGA